MALVLVRKLARDGIVHEADGVPAGREMRADEEWQHLLAIPPRLVDGAHELVVDKYPAHAHIRRAGRDDLDLYMSDFVPHRTSRPSENNHQSWL